MKKYFKFDPVYISSILLFVLGISSYFLQFIFNSYMTHQLSPNLYGDFSVAINLLALMVNIFVLGTGTVSVKFLPRYLAADNRTLLDHFMRWVFRTLRVSFTVCFSIAILVMAAMLAFTKTLNNYHIAAFMFWVTPFAVLLDLLQKFILGEGYPLVYSFQLTLIYITQLIFFFIAASLLHIPLTSLNITFILILTCICLMIIAGSYLWIKDKKFFWLILRDLFKKPIEIKSEWKKMAYKVVLSIIIFTASVSMGLFILELISPNEEEVGYYSVVLIICSILPLTTQCIIALAQPKIDLYTKKEKPYPLSELQSLLDKMNIINLIITLILATIILLYGKDILALFGADYVNAYLVLIICDATALLASIAITPTNLLMFSDNINTLLKINAVQLFLVIFLSFALTYPFNIIGTITAAFLTQLTVTTALAYYTRKKLNIRSILIF